MVTFRPKGSIQGYFNDGRMTNKLMITGDYLVWSPNHWSRWEDTNSDLTTNSQFQI